MMLPFSVPDSNMSQQRFNSSTEDDNIVTEIHIYLK